jgi:hypothetical protein
MWTLLEPVHALTYFAPEAKEAFAAAGLRGFWRGYFAGRLAPLGPIDAPVATAVLFGFAPGMVARGIPDVWSRSSPEAALAARLAGVDAVLQRLWDVDSPALPRLGELLRRAADTPVGGRPLFAANAGLAWPEPPHLAVWHAATLLREHRGDGHVAALVAAGLDPVEALVTHAAAGGALRSALQPNRGWTDEEWAAAGQRLTGRGWLTAEGALTAAGAAVRAGVEEATDGAAATAFAALSPPELAELDALLVPLAGAIAASGIVPFPNPMGVPRPASAPRSGDSRTSSPER